jgi:hypothetical protein
MKKTLLASALLLLSGMASAAPWTEVRNYDTPSVAVGAMLPIGINDNKNNLPGAAGGRNSNVYVDNAHTHPVGNGYADSKVGYSVRVNQNAVTWNSLGIAPATNIPTAEGDEIWARGWVYFPVGMPLNNRPKVMRIMAGGAGGVGADYVWGNGSGPPYALLLQGAGNISYYIDAPGYNHPEYGWIREATIEDATFKMGQWNILEMYVKVSSNPAVGKWRVWLNTKPLWDITLRTAGSYAPEGNTPTLVFWSNWDSPAPANADSWVDDAIMTNDPAMATQTDNRGNKMIGTREAHSSPSSADSNSNSNTETPSMHLHVCSSIELCNPANYDNFSNCEVVCESLKFRDDRQQLWRIA